MLAGYLVDMADSPTLDAANRASFDASPSDRVLRCHTCDKIIPDGSWFARIKAGDERIAFCRPHCLEVYLGSPENAHPLEQARL